MYHYTVQYQDVDGNSRLRLYTLVNYLLNTAGLDADEFGFGQHYLHPQNMTWVLTNLSLEMKRMPQMGEDFQIETWVQSNMHMLSIRNFRLYAGDELIGQARSHWAVINLSDRTIQNIFDQPVFAEYQYGESVDIERQKHHKVTPPELMQHSEHLIRYSDIDYNRHCNSCKYIEFMLNVCELPSDFEQFRFDIKYSKELHYGEMAYIGWLADKTQDSEEPQQTVHYVIRDKDDTLCVVASVQEIK
ncbi:MAG: hypothetical protein IJ756_02345 [Paludibacteraceae bacterium]|nr:hypothetical protein [Paludibacteraceae bacterium]